MLIIEAAIAVFEPTRGCDEPLFPSNPYCFSPPDAKKNAALANGVKNMVEMKGLEPSTPTLRTWCSPS